MAARPPTRTTTTLRVLVTLALVTLTLVTLAGALATARAQPGGDLIAHRDLTYIPRDPNLGHNAMQLDLYLPGGDSGPYPVVLLLHDYHGAKAVFRSYARDLTAQGWAVVAPDWRFAAAGFPYDAFCARAWINAQAAHYNLDHERVAVFGAALGGQIAALMGAADDPGLFISGECPYPVPDTPLVAGVATWGGYLGTDIALQWPSMRGRWAVLADVTPRDYNRVLDTLITVPPREWRSSDALDPAARAIAMQFPLYWVDGSEPPYLLLHGRDSFGEIVREQATFAGHLSASGVAVTVIDKRPFTHHIGALAGHLDELIAFLDQVFAPVGGSVS